MPVAAVSVFAILFFSSCSSGPQELKPGTANCYFCKMTISDVRFGAEIVTKKGRVYKFDDSYCLLAYIKTKDLSPVDINNTYLTSFTGDHRLLNSSEALLLQSNNLRGPMGGNLAACKEADSLKKLQQQYHGTAVRWNEISNQ